tara:strand:+ start:621 stop:1835 length:1215 start_codon:yes stop_codon:yes gene_type:complete
MKIGITISLEHNLFSSGINQNAFYLSIMFCEAGHECILLGHLPPKDGKKQKIEDGLAFKQLQKAKGPYDLEMKSFNDVWDDYFDVIIYLGTNMQQKRILNLKKVNPKIKFVLYQCGNQFLIDMEGALFNQHKERFGEGNVVITTDDDPETRIDAVWQIPQMEPTNWAWAMHTRKVDNVTVVPFVWDPIFIQENFKNKGYKICSPSKDFKKVGIMEPNLSVMKNFLIPLVICERVNKVLPLNKVKVYGTKEIIKNNIRANQILTTTKLREEGKISSEARHTTPDVLEKWSHTIVSWQWTNPLNYLYFDIAWMGYPIIHNAHICKDVGYFYEGVDVLKAEQQVKWVINNHGEHIKNYTIRNRTAIKRYTKDNKNLIKQYDMLLQDLVTDKFQRYNYDEELNLIYKK